MALQRLSTPYGPAAFRALRAAIDQVQAGDPLAAVTVLVHSNAVGVSARRWLAANGGIAAAQFLTPFRFAELLGGPALVKAGKRPVSTPVVDVAVRSVLAGSAGLFHPIAQHQATITAVRDTHRDLCHLPPAAVQRLATRGSARAREVVRLHREVQALLQAQWYDEAQLLHAACAAAAVAPQRTVVFLPQRLRASEQALLAALAQHGQVVLIEGLQQPPQGITLELVDASDADEEAREAVRTVVAAVHEGLPLHRIGIVWPRHEPYARLVSEQLHEAGIPWNGRPGIALHERLAARLVLDVLRLDRRGIRRADLFALLAHVPARRPDGSAVHRQQWERLSRDAGLSGDADWHTRLVAYRDVHAAAALQTTQPGAQFHQREAEAAGALHGFVVELKAQLGPPGSEMPWRHWAQLAHRLLGRWLGGHRGVAALPPDELEAYGAVQAALDRLECLDALAQPTTRAVFAHTLEAELDTAPGRTGRIGTGVHIGPLSFAVGQALQLLVVVGACEGLLPAPPPPEALLGDGDRSLTDGALPLNADLVADQQRQLWAALAGTERAVLVAPRGDLRATAVRQPSRWVAELAAILPASARSVPSFAAGLADAAFPATLSQHRIRALAHATRTGRPVAQHPLVQRLQPLRAGVQMLQARQSALLTEYDGDLSGVQVEALGERPVSPTRLEAWVACPHAWFLQHVLGVEPVEQPDEQLQITPRDRGTLVHAALDRFHALVLSGELPQPGPQGWTPTHLAALLQCFQMEAQQMQQQGVVGRVAFWQAEQARQRHELQEWMRHDSEHIANRGAQVIASEHRFGFDQSPPAVIPLPDGSVVRLRGSVDRIDRCADGTLVVTDHKTGSLHSYRDITNADPTAGGTKLQLPAYAAAALALAGQPVGTPVVAEYGFLGRAEFKRVTCTIDDHGWPQVSNALAHIVQGIRSGLFVARPDKSQYRLSFTPCPWCDPDNLGTADKWAEFERKQHDPRVAELLGLAPPDEPGTPGGATEVLDG
ncbi:MAG: PD-(D/E)XK nuclease family protein [Actinomycetota bacterium]|nr:PD-(D/E)XK nuclease family protein [Actinomycetota bacterium]